MKWTANGSCVNVAKESLLIEEGINSPLIKGQVVAKFAALSPAMNAPNTSCITINTSNQIVNFFKDGETTCSSAGTSNIIANQQV